MFDKDDLEAVQFVTAAANLRASNFSIPMESFFKVKEMAGKIVPAISSSNAIAASLQVGEAIKLLSGQKDNLRGMVYKRTDESVRMNSYGRTNDQPNPDCLVCSDDSKAIVLCIVKDFSAATLEDLKQTVLLDHLKLSPSSFVIEFESRIIYEYDQEMIDDADPDDKAEIEVNVKRLQRSLADHKLQHQAVLQVQGSKDGQDQVVIVSF